VPLFKYWTAIEALVCDTKISVTQEIIKELSVSLIMGGYHFVEMNKFKDTCDKIAYLYDLRCQIVHKGEYSNATALDLTTIRQYAIWMVLNSLGRRSIGYQQFSQIKIETDRLYNMLTYNDPLPYLASCGLDCIRCADYRDGDIKRYAAKLHELLGNYSRLAKIKAAAQPAFYHHQNFENLLNYFSSAQCGGCRSEACYCPVDCTVKSCQEQNKANYCYECSLFPCDNPPFSKNLRERWLQANNRMKEIGPIEYYIEQGKLPRY